ncbi:MAG: class C sortase [Eubacteriales bacterium]
MKKSLSIVLCVLVFLVGLTVMFYPTVSNWLHEQTASYAIADYWNQASTKTADEYEDDFEAARAYNRTLSGDTSSLLEAFMGEDTDYQNDVYWTSLDAVNGIMGILSIPSIDVALPIYHGTDESALQKGIGHLEGSALPTGDVGNHTVLTGHTGLPSAELLTDLIDLQVGDTFQLQILDRNFNYEVINIYTVLPSETENLKAQADKDLVTLVTCTPYGVNSHRLLVQGIRTADTEVEETTDLVAQHVDETSTALASLPVLIPVAIGMGVLLLVAILVAILRSRYRPKHTKKSDKTD